VERSPNLLLRALLRSPVYLLFPASFFRLLPQIAMTMCSPQVGPRIVFSGRIRRGSPQGKAPRRLLGVPELHPSSKRIIGRF